MSITISLNDQQKKAVHHVSGSLLVVAGAGSGKTRVITARIAHLIIECGVPPSSIIALTFTNKAANEMKERIAQFIGSDMLLPFVGTFHSYCVRLLKENNALLEVPFISILDDDDQRKLLSGILHRSNLHKQISPRQASYLISQMKNKNLAFSKKAEELFDHPLMPDIYRAYEREKRESKSLDFDDLLVQAVRLFKQQKTFKQFFQADIRHILVDEYQDTNVIQHELLKQMALSNKKLIVDSICAVGDEDQSIYAWRGATVSNMLNFKKDFSTTTRIAIEQNYRSVQPILEIANNVIKHNSERSPKKLWSERTGSNRIKKITFLSEHQEADAISQLASISRNKDPKKTVAVLYRTHAQSRAVEESLLRHGIPYKIIGGIQFYERKEIKDLLAYLKLVVNPFDRASLFRIINTPARGLGAKFEEQLYEQMNAQPFLTFTQVIENIQESLPPSRKKAIKLFLATFDNLTPDSKPTDAIKQIIDRIEYTAYLKKTYEGEEVNTRLENVQELLDAMSHAQAQDTKSVAQFLEDVALMQEKLTASDTQENKVLLMTLHAAKGLEFDVVILAGLEEGILPTSRSLYEESGSAIEEERRLFYVGITRAKEYLLFCHAKFRYTYGQMVDQLPSQFLDELPRKLVPYEDCAYWNHSQLRQFFADWVGVKAKVSENNPFATLIKNKIEEAPSRKKAQSKSTQKKSIKSSLTQESKWIKNQPVRHKTYGLGLIQKVEKKNAQTLVTVSFKGTIKKIVADFLQSI